MIQVRELSRSFAGRPALRGISFEVGRGEIVGLLGPNGAGKSTCLRILVGLLAPDSGEVHVDGLELPLHGAATRQRMGYVAEGAPVPVDLRVEEYLRFRAALRLAGRAARREEVDRVLDLCDLEPARRRICGQLSRGYRQRLSLADALLGAPPILVLDEPTVGLDPNQLAQVRRLIGALSGKHTVLLSSHLLGEVEAVCSKVIILNQGWVVAQGALADLSAEAGGGGLVVRVGGADKASLAEALISVEGIEAVEEAGAGEGTLRLRCMVTDAVRGAVAARVVARGWDLLELTDASPDLEQVFAGLTREDQ